MDDELIGFFFKFTNEITTQFNTNITGVNEIFLTKKILTK